MARDLTAGMVTEVTAEALAPIFLVKTELDSGDLNLWTGYDDLVWSGDTYVGAGELLGFAPVQETQELRAVGVKFSLSGVPTSLISPALSEDYQGRPISMWLGAFDSNKAIVGDPALLFKGRLDTMNIEDTGPSATISVSAENVLISLERPNERRYTSEDQKTSYPTDKGFDFVPSLQEKEVVWGTS